MSNGREHKQEPVKESYLQEAERLINGSRNKEYGDPKENFADIARLWTNYKGIHFSALDVAIFNILQKVARCKRKPKRDNFVDIAGYAGTVEKLDVIEG